MAQTASVTGSIPNHIDSLLYIRRDHWIGDGGEAGTWNPSKFTVGQPATAYYTFLLNANTLSGMDANGFAPMSDAQKQAVVSALGQWSSVANITFVQTDDVAKANLRFGTNNQQGISAGYAYDPNPGGSKVLLANDQETNKNPTPGSYGYETILHEIGHAIGLKHPGNYSAFGNGSDAPYLPSEQDNTAYSVMSYNNNTSLKTGIINPSVFDISAVQYLYGANMGAGQGNNTYGMSKTFQTIWDPNGINTLSAADQTANCTIDLRQGGFCKIGETLSASISYGTSIYNAIGGAGNDTIVVNGLNNRIDGGAGNDTVVFSGALSQYKIMSVTTGAYAVVGPDG